MIDEILAKFDGAFAENTLRAYRSELGKFQIWSNAAGCSPFSCSTTTVARYVEYISENLAPASVSRNLVSLSTVLKLSDYEDHTKAPEVVLATKRMYRNKGRFQQQTTPLTRKMCWSSYWRYVV